MDVETAREVDVDPRWPAAIRYGSYLLLLIAVLPAVQGQYLLAVAVGVGAIFGHQISRYQEVIIALQDSA